jgi:hypothetical protein
MVEFLDCVCIWESYEIELLFHQSNILEENHNVISFPAFLEKD